MDALTVLVVATLDTKAAETDFLTECLSRHGVTSKKINLALETAGKVLDGASKLEAMDAAVAKAIVDVDNALADNVHAVVGLGGGTGGELILKLMQSLPITFPKVLITTLPFDPRIAVADSSIVLVPTLADLCGLNATLREILENSAAMTAGLCNTRRHAGSCVADRSIGITALGATNKAVKMLVDQLYHRQKEATVFHSNGFGGAAFARFAKRGAFDAIVDVTPHEMTRIKLVGAHVPMPERFSAAGDLPRVVLPGALNFIGLGDKALVPGHYLERPHYEHSGFFTHVKVTPDEMKTVSLALAESMNSLQGPCSLVVPMGGFSHQDCSGGQIEDLSLRELFLATMRAALGTHIPIKTVDAHISSQATVNEILNSLDAVSGNE
ncbi:MAG: Tm-1-like ATP-binding domain-containing protein [Pseudomonadota bacterium]